MTETVLCEGTTKDGKRWSVYLDTLDLPVLEVYVGGGHTRARAVQYRRVHIDTLAYELGRKARRESR